LQAKENPLRCYRLLLISVGVIPETAKANGLKPYAYLRYVFTELPKAQTVDAIEVLLPGNINPVVGLTLTYLRAARCLLKVLFGYCIVICMLGEPDYSTSDSRI